MRILHISPNSPYNEGWGYQENLLPKYQRKAGNEVTVIVTNLMHQNGSIQETECTNKVLEDGVRLIRLPRRRILCATLTTLFSILPVKRYLEEWQPDFIFCHGLMSRTILSVIRYCKKSEKKGHHCVIVQDNHLDYNIGFPKGGVLRHIQRWYYRKLNKRTQDKVSKIYGVTPWRKEYAKEYFRIKESKMDVLIMGADDEKIDFEHRNEIRATIRMKYHVGDEEFFIVTGGKIDGKKNTLELIKACKEIEGVRLLVFGSLQEEIREEFEELVEQGDKVDYIGWIPADEVYNYFMAADLIVFPGNHSVLWEQACASKTPCLFKNLDGMHHVDNGGNAKFLADTSTASIRQAIKELLFTEEYLQMKCIAESDATDIYLYSNITYKSLECMKES